MPLFSSRFSFKKSPARRSSSFRNASNIDTHSQEEDEDSSSSDSFDETVKEVLTRDKRNSGDKKKLKTGQQQIVNPSGRKSIVKNGKNSSLSAKKLQHKSKHLIKNPNNLIVSDQKNPILLIDQYRRFQFDHKNGIWSETSRNVAVENGRNESNFDSISSKPETKTRSDADQSDHHQIPELVESIKTLEEENRLLKLKIEILIEMITETTAELNLKGKKSSS